MQLNKDLKVPSQRRYLSAKPCGNEEVFYTFLYILRIKHILRAPEEPRMYNGSRFGAQQSH